ncbi:hypothetical protein Tco_0304696 [Tanacetum coccineum]
MGLLHLEGPAIETIKASQLQPSPEQLMLPIHRLEDQVVIEETSFSFSLDVANARVQRLRGNAASRYTVSPISAADHEVSGAGPFAEVPSPSKVVFEKEELETTPKHTTAG